jgi:hypothetical protein
VRLYIPKIQTGALPAAITASSSSSSRARSVTSLNEFLSAEERSDKIARWSEIRSMTKEEAHASLAPVDVVTYDNYYAEVREGVLKMQELATLIMQSVDKTKGIAPKTKGQRKRDKYARVQARAAGNAAAALRSPS